jgi:hypothetical protein
MPGGTFSSKLETIFLEGTLDEEEHKLGFDPCATCMHASRHVIRDSKNMGESPGRIDYTGLIFGARTQSRSIQAS